MLATSRSSPAGTTEDSASLQNTSSMTSAARLIDDKDSTAIAKLARSRAGDRGRVKQIRAQVEETTSDYDRESCRSGWRSSSAASLVIKVGALPRPR